MKSNVVFADPKPKMLLRQRMTLKPKELKKLKIERYKGNEGLQQRITRPGGY